MNENLSTPVVPAGEWPTNLPEFFARAAHTPMDTGQWPTPLSHRMFDLSPIELATIRFHEIKMQDVIIGLGDLSEAQFRVAQLFDRNGLPWISALRLARALEAALGGRHPFALRRARIGFSLIGSMIDLGMLEATVDAEPTPDAPRTWRRIDLRARLVELDRAEAPLTRHAVGLTRGRNTA